MKDRSVIHPDHLDDPNDRVADYLYVEIRGALFQGHTNHLEQQPLHDPFQLQPFGV